MPPTIGSQSAQLIKQRLHDRIETKLICQDAKRRFRPKVGRTSRRN